MVTGLWGKKVGMTQVFDKNKVIPVTVLDIDRWIVTNIRKKDRDGYSAIQVGRLRNKYALESFSLGWLKQLKKYFSHVREIKVADIDKFQVGKPLDFYLKVQSGDLVDVTGHTIGRGFAGVVKRHGFSGAPGSHGSKMGNRPGSIGHYCSEGKVIKGKRLPGHMGLKQRVVRGLKVVRFEPAKKIMLVKGSVPGKSGALLYVRKA